MGLLARLAGSTAMTPADAAAAAAKGDLILIDVREPAEFSAGHSPHARNMPLASLGTALETVAADGRPLAFVCRSGARSARATRQAKAAGIDAHNVGGGMIAWQRAGGDRGDQPRAVGGVLVLTRDRQHDARGHPAAGTARAATAADAGRSPGGRSRRPGRPRSPS
jgi:rhodanese-related sulfurtransferase